MPGKVASYGLELEETIPENQEVPEITSNGRTERRASTAVFSVSRDRKISVFDHKVSRREAFKLEEDRKEDELRSFGKISQLSSLYAIIVIVIAFVVTIAEALQRKQTVHSTVNAVYQSLMQIVSTLFLIFLQIYEIPRSRRIQEEEDTKNIQHAECINEANFSIHEEHRKSIDGALMFNENSCTFGSTEAIIGSNESHANSAHSAVQRTRSQSNVASYIFEHEGTDFFVRLGCVVFGIGYLVFLGLEIFTVYDIRLPPECRPRHSIRQITGVVFIVVQAFFIFKHYTMDIVIHKPIVNFGFKHMVATNFSAWLFILVQETVEAFEHHDDKTANKTNLTDCSKDNLAVQASSLLFPFIFEYNLCAVAIGYTLMQNAMHRRYVRAPTWEDTAEPETKSGESGVDFQKAHSGLFGGLVTVALVIVSMILFRRAYNDQSRDVAKYIYFATTYAMVLSSIIAVAWAFWKMRQHHHHRRPKGIDDLLLLLGLIGTLVFDAFAGYASVVSLSTSAFSAMFVFVLVKTLLSVMQSIGQTLLIIAARRRYAGTNELLAERPGRAQITFLILTNLASWLYKSLQMKEGELDGFMEDFYGFLPWTLITRMCLPILLFYRFHSSACFAEIWHAAFTKHEH